MIAIFGSITASEVANLMNDIKLCKDGVTTNEIIGHLRSYKSKSKQHFEFGANDGITIKEYKRWDK